MEIIMLINWNWFERQARSGRKDVKKIWKF